MYIIIKMKNELQIQKIRRETRKSFKYVEKLDLFNLFVRW